MIKAILITLIILFLLFVGFCMAALIAVILAAYGEDNFQDTDYFNNNNNQK